MDGYQFENACADYLRRNGFKDVRVTQASRDQGADIIAVLKKEKYAVQCKYYAKPVGNKAVQEVYAAATFYGCDRAVVMTNNTFTKGAKELAESLGVELMPGIDPVRRRLGPGSVLMLLAGLLAAGLLSVLLFWPDSPYLPRFLSEESVADYRDKLYLVSGIVLAVSVLFFLRHRIKAVLTRRAVEEDVPEDETAEDKRADEMADEGLEDEPETLAVLYDLVGIAERTYHGTDDPDEKREIYETLERAYGFLIAREEDIPEGWESPAARREQLRAAEEAAVDAADDAFAEAVAAMPAEETADE